MLEGAQTTAVVPEVASHRYFWPNSVALHLGRTGTVSPAQGHGNRREFGVAHRVDIVGVPDCVDLVLVSLLQGLYADGL